VSDAIEVDGEVGQVPESVTFATPLEVTGLERTVAVEGDGTAIHDGDYVTYALAVYNGETGELASADGFDGEQVQPIQVAADQGAAQFFGCATVGSRIVMAVPGNESTPGAAYVLDILGAGEDDTWCTVTDDPSEMPAVSFDDEGVPTITIPDADAPDEVQLEVLEEGDGAVVEPGDNVTVDYTGVKWSDGSTFDSSFERGQPATFATNGVVVGFQRALEGQKVGSTVLVTMPPRCGYGEDPEAHELGGETLVFVVNIIEAAKP